MDQLNLRDVEWDVITRENVDEKFEELESRGESVVFFGLTANGYEALSLNLSDLRSYVESQQAVITRYENHFSNQ